MNKEYKLLKDLPTFKAGDIFTLTENGDLRLKQTVDERNEGRLIFAYSAQTLKKFPEILKEWFEEIPEEHKRWRAGHKGFYYYVDDWGRVQFCVEGFIDSDDYLYSIGNYFDSIDKAEKHKEYLIALQTLEDDTKGFVPDWDDTGQPKWFVEAFAASGECLNIDFTVFNKGAIYFSSRGDAEESIKLHKKEWKTVLGVEK